MTTLELEFVGGPFDGHSQTITVPPDDLAPQAAMLVSQDMFRLIDGRLPTKNAPITSIAFYQRELSDGMIRYCFVGARSPIQLNVEG